MPPKSTKTTKTDTVNTPKGAARKSKAAAKTEAANAKVAKTAPKAKQQTSIAPAADKTSKTDVKKRVKRDKDAPKKPMSPFFCYQAVRRPQLKLEQPTLKNTEIIKVMSQEWNQLSDDAKQPHLKQTEIQKQHYESAMKVYKAKKAEEEVAEQAKQQNASVVAEVPKKFAKKRPPTKSIEALATEAAVIQTPKPVAPLPVQVSAPVAVIPPVVASKVAPETIAAKATKKTPAKKTPAAPKEPAAPKVKAAPIKKAPATPKPPKAPKEPKAPKVPKAPKAPKAPRATKKIAVIEPEATTSVAAPTQLITQILEPAQVQAAIIDKATPITKSVVEDQINKPDVEQVVEVVQTIDVTAADLVVTPAVVATEPIQTVTDTII